MNGGGVVAAVAGQQGQWRCNRRGSGVILAVAGPKERWPCNRRGSGGIGQLPLDSPRYR